MIAGLVVLALLLLVLLVTVIGLVLEVISLRTVLRSLDHDSVGEVKGSVRRLESNMNNSTKYYLTKLNSLYKRVAVLEAEKSSSEKQMLVSPEASFSAGIKPELAAILQLVLAICWLKGCVF